MGRNLLGIVGLLGLALVVGGRPSVAKAHGGSDLPHFLHIKASTKHERGALVNQGFSIEFVRSDGVYGFASDSVLERLKANHAPIVETIATETLQPQDFPRGDERFHNYARMTAALDKLVADHPTLLKKWSIGKTVQGRDMWVVQVNSTPGARGDGKDLVSSKPGIIFMGNHHAREHVSAEIPLMLLEFLARNYGVDRDITRLVDGRDIYIVPMVNPDGVEFDIADGRYKWQRKNMQPNRTSKPGVDLNRNYGFMWGTGGSSTDPSSDVYMGPSAFSEPETQAIKAFVESRSNLKILLTFHTFSELILYPWGHKHDPISNSKDLATYRAMATKMAEWNHYTPEQSSDLYIASGDTTDWSYGAQGIFSFTFELSPKDMWGGGGFYPGAGIIDRVFQDNLRPALYLIDLADDPHRAQGLSAADLDWLTGPSYLN